MKENKENEMAREQLRAFKNKHKLTWPKVAEVFGGELRTVENWDEGLNSKEKEEIERILQNSENKEEVERLFFHVNNLFHTRITIFLLSETILFAIAANVLKHSVLFFVISSLGAVITIIFTIINIKLGIRVEWLITRFKAQSKLYDEYLEYKDIKTKDMNFVEKFIYNIESTLKKDSLIRKASKEALTCGLGTVFFLAWVFLLIWSWF